MNTFICPSCKQPDTPTVKTAFLDHKNVTCTKCGAVARYPMAWGLRIVLWGFTAALAIALLNGHFTIILPVCVIGCIFDLFLLLNAPTTASDSDPVASAGVSTSTSQPNTPSSTSVPTAAAAEPFRPQSPPGEAHLGHALIGLFAPFIGLPMGLKRLKQGQREIGMRLLMSSIWFGFIWIVFIIAVIWTHSN